MSIFEIVKEALRIGRAHKALWLFGFFVGFDIPGGGGEGQPPTPPVPATPPDPGLVATVVLAGIAVVIVFVVLKYVSTAALIEGVKRARANAPLTMREGFREGWAHWGVLLRVALLFLAANAASVLVLVGVSALAGRAFGQPALFAVGGLAAVVGVPWLVTLYMWHAFAERIAVLENRRALDAIRKARLFLHGRLQLGLKLIVASFIGVLAVAAAGFLVIGPIVLLVRALVPLWPAFAIGVLMVLPAVFVVFAIIGVVTSSVWTIGYLTRVEQ
jgi:hypothetical protein